MTPKEKAEELVNIFSTYCDGSIDENVISSYKQKYNIEKVVFNEVAKYAHEYHAKQCALIAVNEILKVTHSDKRANSPFDKEYWEKVKTEIENL